ncbi:MAG: AAA family ATPase [Pseudomonadota bacterium]
MSMSMDAADNAHKLGCEKRSGKGWVARCPAHDDKKASLVIYDRSGGGVNVKCMADCEQRTVITKLLSLKLWPEPGMRKDPSKVQAAKDRKRRKEIVEVLDRVPDDMPEPDWNKLFRSPPTTVYGYRDIDGSLLSYVTREDQTTGEKRILPVSVVRSQDGSFSWAVKAPKKFTLYGLELLAEKPGAQVFIVEGEKAADRGRKLFQDAVTLSWRGGASAVEKNDFAPISGRNVIIIPDADDAGRSAAKKAAEKAQKVGAGSVRIVDVPSEFPKGWDIADPIPSGWTLERLLEREAEPATDEPTDKEKDHSLIPYVLSATELVKLDVPAREFIVEPFIATQSLNMLYAARGVGKTWIALTLALAVARGEDFLGYLVERERSVLYVDGEMPLPDIQERLLALDPNPPSNLMILPSELLYRNDLPINLQSDDDRSRIDELLEYLNQEEKRPSLVILDNLSSMSGGIDENDNSALDQFLQWMVGLRHEGAAILLIHHAGKSGAQRGASRREDFLDTSIELKPPSKDKDDDEADFVPHQGAHLILTFPKTRGRRPEPEELELKLQQDGERLVWTVGEVRTIDRTIKLLRVIWETSPETQKDLAKAIGRSDGRISQLCKKLRKNGLIEASPSLKLTTEGRDELLGHFPELEQKMLQQGELYSGRVV